MERDIYQKGIDTKTFLRQLKMEKCITGEMIVKNQTNSKHS